LKHRTSRCIPGNPQPSLVSLYDRAADRQAHAHTGRFCREERIEYATDILRAEVFEYMTGQWPLFEPKQTYVDGPAFRGCTITAEHLAI
jgi:hypothetical protein